MQYDLEIDGRQRRVVVSPAGGGFAVTIDGRMWQVDAAPIVTDLMSLLISDVSPNGDTGQAHFRRIASQEVAFWPAGRSGQMTVALAGAVSVTVNRHRRGSDDAHTRGGPQRLVAPMPGKIVRLLVKPGDVVHARQPLVVVEAMKMENEVRAGADGKVAEVHVNEGESVDAGALLVVIE